MRAILDRLTTLAACPVAWLLFTPAGWFVVQGTAVLAVVAASFAAGQWAAISGW